MKRLEELGVSPAPWKVDDQDVMDASGGGLVYYYYSPFLRKADAKLISAAPELYEALREAYDFIEQIADAMNGLPIDVAMNQRKARVALAKAGGEEEDNEKS